MSGDLADGMLAMVDAKPPAVDAATRMVAIVRRRALDAEDAALLLDALDLDGQPRPPAKSNIVTYTHGTQSGVDYHLARGHASLCAACERWAAMRERRARSCEDGGCDSPSAYWAHRNAREPTCEPSRAAYRVYCRERAAKGPAAR